MHIPRQSAFFIFLNRRTSPIRSVKIARRDTLIAPYIKIDHLDHLPVDQGVAY